MTDSVLAQALIYLAAAVVFVPIAKRAGLGAVLGYLVGGVVIGPWVLGLVGGEGHHVMHFAEFGVVMMLFLVGLELRPALLWQMRRPIFGLGGLQVSVTAAAIFALALVVGIEWKMALAVGMTFAMSSTAIVLSTLAEKGLLKTAGGQSSFAVLLFQDISVIPILAIFPLLGATATKAASEILQLALPDGTTLLIALPAEPGLPAWASGLLVIGAVVGVVGIGRFIVRPVFQFLAGAKLRESFTAATLLIVVGIALLMQVVGLSPALGTFLAGVVLADSEYRHELETDIEPFKGLLLGLFFISIGAQIDFGLIGSEPVMIVSIVLVSMAAKLAVLYGLARLFELDRTARWTFAFSLAQIGEFAFVLLSFGVQSNIYDQAFAAPLVAAVAISMVLTPPMFILLERVVLPRVARRAEERKQDEVHDDGSHVIIAGYGRFGQIIGRMLRANKIPMTILDLDPEIVDFVGRLGIKVYYGDASRVDLLHAAGAHHAKLFVLAVDDADQATEICKHVREHFPHLPILARAKDRQHYWQLRRAGAKKVFRETFASSWESGIAALQELGYRANTAHRLATRWRQHEEELIEDLTALYGTADQDTFLRRTRDAFTEAEKLMRDENPSVFGASDAAWDNESLRADRKVDAAADPASDG
jgi:monovalent cation:proton antiporter-2 (CPA2) family protein